MSCCNVKQCGGRVMVKTLQIADSSIYGGSSDVTAGVRVVIPSRLLHCTLLAFARNANGSAHTYGATEKWQITPQGFQVGDNPLEPVFVNSAGVATPRALPGSYEFETGIKIARLTVVVASTGVKAKSFVQAIFEPAVGGISQQELDELFSFCELTMDGPRIVVQ